jgi:diaminobutyrate-2-oxoglutarate transaminase
MNNHVLPFPNKYHWFDKEATEDEMVEQSLTMFEQLFTDDESGVAVPACVLLECVQGEGGVVVAPFKWVQGIRRLCTKYDIPMICDEVQSGFMRTGKMFAFNHSDITPDVLILSKALGGSMPMAMILYNPKLDVWTGGAHSGTFRGNQISFVVGYNVLKYLRTSKMDFRVNLMSDFVFNGLNNLCKKYSNIIKEVRGLGLMIGVQIDHSGITARMIQNDLFNKHQIIIECGGRAGSVLRLLCSLEIHQIDIEYFITSLDSTLQDLDREHCSVY